MKIPEMRELLEQHDARTLRVLALELYRALSAKRREEIDADRLARDPAAWAAGRKASAGGSVPSVDPFFALHEAETFMEHAEAQHYFAPNRFIAKDERSHWRFVAKRVYRSLLALTADAESARESAAVLERFFRVICRGEEVYLFPSVEPFQAMGVAKEEVLRAVVAAQRRVRPPAELIDSALNLLLTTFDASHLQPMVAAIVAELPSPDLRQELVERTERRLRLPGAVGAGSTSSSSARSEPWRARERRLALASVILHARLALHETDQAIERFLTITRDVNALLHALAQCASDELWLHEFERAAATGADLRAHAYHYQELSNGRRP